MYCIAVRTGGFRQITYVRQAMDMRTDAGLLVPDRRFTEGIITDREPLEPAGFVNGAAALAGSENGLSRLHWAEGSTWRVVYE